MSLAADSAACGDGAVDGVEQCDDGNLVSGDGCSNQCTLEKCGNGVRDIGEQCDDGNSVSADGCSSTCKIEFCGDGVVQSGTGEECDDGNNVSGDGCSSLCKLEGKQSSSSSSSVSSSVASVPPEVKAPEPEKPTMPKPPEQTANEKVPVPTVVVPKAPVIAPEVRQAMEAAQAATTLLETTAAADYKPYLSPEQGQMLGSLLDKVATGKPLTPEEKVQAASLVTTLSDSKVVERDKYVSILKEFIATPVSATVIATDQLNATTLSSTDVPGIIDELMKVPPKSMDEVRVQVAQDIDRLRTEVGVDPLASVGDVTQGLTVEAKPLQTFAAIKSIKDVAEKQATMDLGGSLALLKREAETLRQSSGILTQEYGVKAKDIDEILAKVNAAVANPQSADIRSVVSAVQSVLAPLQQKNLLSRQELLSAADGKLHPAATARLSQQVQLTQNPKLTASIDGQPATQDLKTYAPAQAKSSFERGTIADQKQAMIDYLAKNERLQSIRTDLKNRGVIEVELRYKELVANIGKVGEPNASGPCQTSVADALLCVNNFLTDAEKTARSQGFFGRTVGTLQDFFGIGQ
jgi:cysteine-rich repeat protein